MGQSTWLDEAEVNEFIAAIRDIEPVLVIFDTLSRCLVGVDENAQSAMTLAVDNLDKIRLSVPNLTVSFCTTSTPREAVNGARPS